MPTVGTGTSTAPARTTGPLSGKTGEEKKSSPREKRRDSRFQIPIDVSIAFLGTNGNADFQEPGLIIDISKHGACIMSTREAQVGDRLMITMMHEEFSARATVKAVNTGQGGVWNLHVEFLDKVWMGGSL
jgi:alpha-galactosidase